MRESCFYSIFYLSPNITIDERVSIGLIYSDGRDSLFKYSKEKLTASKRLFEDVEAYRFARDYLKSLQDTLPEEHRSFHGQLFEGPKFEVRKKYLGYLSKYGNNLIRVGEPRQISTEFSLEHFQRLFMKKVFKDGVSVEQESQPTFERAFNTRVRQYVNIDLRLTSEHFDQLISPVSVSFIGKKEQVVAGQILNFQQQRIDVVQHRLQALSSLILALNGKGKDRFYTVSNEPERSKTKHHQLWTHLRSLNYIEHVDVSEADRVAEYLKDHQVQPLIPAED